MKRNELSGLACSVARTLAVVGDAWSLLVLREAFMGTRRFEDFQAQTGASPTILTARLKKLAAAGILDRRKYQQRPARFEFRLSRKGLDLWPVIVGLKQFGDRWLQGGKAPPLSLEHRQCGKPMELSWRCSACGEEVSAPQVHIHANHALRRERLSMRQQFDRSVRRA